MKENILEKFVKYEKSRGKRNTRKYPYIMKVFLKYLDNEDIRLGEVNYKKAQEYQTYLTTLEDEDGSIHYCATTVLDMINVCRNFYDFLKVEGISWSNPFRSIKNMKRKRHSVKDIPYEEDLEKLLEGFRCFWKRKHLRDRRSVYKMHVVSELMYSTGMRLSEVAALKKEDIDFESGTVLIREAKNGKERKAFLNEYAGRVLLLFVTEMRKYVNWNSDSYGVFGVKNGRMLDGMLNRWLKREGANHGFNNFTSHTFRHCLGFHLLRRGCALRYIQLILGHEEINSTEVYTKVDKGDLKNELDRYHPRRFRKIREEVLEDE